MDARYRWLIAIVMCMGALFACVEVDEVVREASPDGKDDQAIIGGKADHLVGDCHSEHILLLLNDPEVDADQLIEDGVHTRAARNIEEFRAGSDAISGTDRDNYFGTIEDVDAVSYVGPVAVQQLVRLIEKYCTNQTWRKAETLFSPNAYSASYIDRIVVKIDDAERSIDMAIYGLSDQRVITALGDAVARGVAVRLIFDGANGDHLDTEGSTSARLEDLGIDVRYINRSMHHKFAIVDGPQNDLLQASDALVFSGSANFTFAAATRNDENITFHQGDAALVLKKQREFNLLWENSRNLVWNEELEYFKTLPIRQEMIPNDTELEILWTSENFETTYSTRWGAGFRLIPFSEAVVSRLVELIDEADSSIYVATRYLRSRPIAKALIDRWQNEPELDVRVYVDQGEYVGLQDHLNQKDDLYGCLVGAANDEREIYNCRERGFRFSYQLHDQGIPIRFKTYAYRWHFTYARQMHHKYLIVDHNTVATGSYNYSNNAEQNSMENVIIYRNSRYPEVVDSFVDNFKTIWETGHDEERFQGLTDHLESADTIDLVFEPAALTWDEVTQVRETIRRRCPDVDSEPFRRTPQHYRNCEAR